MLLRYDGYRSPIRTKRKSLKKQIFLKKKKLNNIYYVNFENRVTTTQYT